MAANPDLKPIQNLISYKIEAQISNRGFQVGLQFFLKIRI
jgi:hypothetical protein